MKTEEWTIVCTAIQTLVIVLSFAGLMFQLRQVSQNMRHDAYSRAIEDFSQIANHLLDKPQLNEFLYSKNEEFKALSKDEKDFYNYLVLSFALYERIFLLSVKGAIELRIWEAWERWLVDCWFRVHLFDVFWRNERAFYTTDFCGYVDAKFRQYKARVASAVQGGGRVGSTGTSTAFSHCSRSPAGQISAPKDIKTVELCILGYQPDDRQQFEFRIDDLVAKLNRLQSSFRFVVGTHVALKDLPHPDYKGLMYKVGPLWEILRRTRADGTDYTVGITRVPLTHDEIIDGSPALGTKYFSLSDEDSVAVVTTSGDMVAHCPHGNTHLQYVAHGIMGELVNIIAKRHMHHPGDLACLMNECEDNKLLRNSMHYGDFCPNCTESILRGDWNLTKEEYLSIRKVLRWCSRSGWVHLLGDVVRNPYVSLPIAGIAWSAKMLPSVLDGWYGYLSALIFVVGVLHRVHKEGR